MAPVKKIYGVPPPRFNLVSQVLALTHHLWHQYVHKSDAHQNLSRFWSPPISFWCRFAGETNISSNPAWRHIFCSSKQINAVAHIDFCPVHLPLNETQITQYPMTPTTRKLLISRALRTRNFTPPPPGLRANHGKQGWSQVPISTRWGKKSWCVSWWVESACWSNVLLDVEPKVTQKDVVANVA